MTEIARALDAFEALIFDINCLAPPLHPGRNRIRRMRKVLAEARKALLAIASNDSFTKDEAPGWVPGAPGAARNGVQPATSTIAAPEDTPREHSGHEGRSSVGPSSAATSTVSDKDASVKSRG